MSWIQAIKARTSTPLQLQLLLLLGTFVGAWASIFGRIAQHEGVPTTVIIAFRMTLGTLALTPIVLHYYRPQLSALSRRDLFICASSGLWMSVHLLTGFAALEHTTILISGIIGGTLPIWVALLEVYILHTRLSLKVWIGLGITLAGGALMTLAGNGDAQLGNDPLLGGFLSLLAALTGAIYAIIGRSVRDKIPFVPYMWLIFGFGAIFCNVIILTRQETYTGYSANGYFALLMLTLLPQLIGHGVYNYVLRRLPATFASLVGQFGIVISAVLAYIFFREAPGWLQIPGSIAMIAGITLVNFARPEKE